jgi:ankyrin repeat protein
MQRAFLILTLGIVVCLQTHGCSCGSKGGNATTKAVDRSSQEAERYWAAGLFFDDPKVLQLCQAIREKNYEQIDRLVKVEGVDINATGWRNMTPLCWAFPLGFAEALDNIPRDANGSYIESEVVAIQQQYLSRHARLLEHLLNLGADPNIQTTRSDDAELSQERKSVYVPGLAFEFPEGFAVTHLAAAGYYRAGFSFLPTVMANGGDPNLDGKYGWTPVFFACGGAFGMMNSGGARAENVAILIEAGADIEVPDADGNTPILVAARGGHSRVVVMLIHAGVDFRVKGERGRDLASSAQHRQRHIVEKCREFFEEFPNADRIRHIDPYHLEVAKFLEQHGLLPDGTHAEWKQEFDQLIEKYGKVAYGDRDPFVDEWVAKRQ